jgi:hypothetical protein
MALTDHAPQRRAAGPEPRECSVAYTMRQLGTDAEREQLHAWLADLAVDLGSVAQIIRTETGYAIGIEALRRHRRAVLDRSGSRCKCVERGAG